MYPMYIGKESNRPEEVEQGAIHEWDEVRSGYHDLAADQWRTIYIPVIRVVNRGDAARRCGVLTENFKL